MLVSPMPGALDLNPASPGFQRAGTREPSDARIQVFPAQTPRFGEFGGDAGPYELPGVRAFSDPVFSPDVQGGAA
jgi:hypothetical protein